MGRLNKEHTPLEGVVKQATSNTHKRRSTRKGNANNTANDTANDTANGIANDIINETVNDTVNDIANNMTSDTSNNKVKDTVNVSNNANVEENINDNDNVNVNFCEAPLKRTHHATSFTPPSRLTRKNLARFNKLVNIAKIGQKDGHNGDQSTENTSAVDQLTTGSSGSDGMTKSNSLSTTVPGFADKVAGNGILDEVSSRPPANLDALRQRLTKPRGSVSAPESVYNAYVRDVQRAGNEARVMYETQQLLQKCLPPSNFALNQVWTAVPKNVGFNDGLSPPQPDYVQGLEKEAFLPLNVNKHLPGSALFKDQPWGLTLPHMAGECKGPSGNLRNAAMQSAYAGAAMVFARDRAMAFAGQPDPAGFAAVSTFTTNGEQLKFYAHYSAPSRYEEKSTGQNENVDNNNYQEYNQYLVQSMSLTSSYEAFQAGRRALRNLQDHAQEQAYALRDQLVRSVEREQPKPADTHADIQPGPSAGAKGRKRKVHDADASGSLPRRRSKRLMAQFTDGEDEGQQRLTRNGSGVNTGDGVQAIVYNRRPPGDRCVWRVRGHTGSVVVCQQAIATQTVFGDKIEHGT